MSDLPLLKISSIQDSLVPILIVTYRCCRFLLWLDRVFMLYSQCNAHLIIFMNACAILNYFHYYYYCYNHNHNKIVKSDWLSTALISALIGQFIRTVRVMPK